MTEAGHIELGPFPDRPGYATAQSLDDNDHLAGFRHRFFFDPEEPDMIYLDGNSLGRLPLAAREVTERLVDEQWGRGLIRSWNDGWWDLQVRLGDRLAGIIGAKSGEVIVSDSTSVNLYKLAMAAARGRNGRHKIVTDDLNFPTDLYVLDGVGQALGDAHRLEVVASNGVEGPVDALERSIDEDTALVSLSHTVFKSGYTYDIESLTETAHRAGALILWDLSHSVGVIPISLGESGADLAVGCTYKYLNGGPGSPAFLYVCEELQSQLENPITAWWGHARPFDFELGFEPVEGIRRFHSGTMPIVSLALIEAGLNVVADAGIVALRGKSQALTQFLIEQWEEHLQPLGFELATPLDPSRRGSHVSLGHEEAWRITQAMIGAAQVLPDFRAPDNIRLGLAPLYTSFMDVHTAVQRIREVVETGTHLHFEDDRPSVT
ncbi:MAG: kynureninase [Acidimicrobiia bacterium]